jgi:hypothetical protein
MSFPPARSCKRARSPGARLSPLAMAGMWVLLVDPGCSSGASKATTLSSATTPQGGSSSSIATASSSSLSSPLSSGSSSASSATSSSGSGTSTSSTSSNGSSSASSSSSGEADAASESDAGPGASDSDSGAAVYGSVAATGCTGKTYKLCEDFETGTVGSLGPNWTKYAGYGVAGPTDVALADDEAHSGKMSLKSDSMERGQTRAQRSLTPIGATAYNHWGRIFYKVQEPSPAVQKTVTNTVLHVTWTSLIGPSGENRVVDIVENMQGEYQWLFNIPTDKCCTNSAYDYTFDSPDTGASNWHCAEWWVDVATESYRFFYDSTEVTALAFSGNANSTMSDYTAVVVGATWYQQNGTILSPFVIWFDDLAIDDTRVGCQ